MHDTSGVHVWLVLMKAYHALAARAEESLSLSEDGSRRFGFPSA